MHLPLSEGNEVINAKVGLEHQGGGGIPLSSKAN